MNKYLQLINEIILTFQARFKDYLLSCLISFFITLICLGLLMTFLQMYLNTQNITLYNEDLLNDNIKMLENEIQNGNKISNNEFNSINFFSNISPTTSLLIFLSILIIISIYQTTCAILIWYITLILFNSQDQNFINQSKNCLKFFLDNFLKVSLGIFTRDLIIFGLLITIMIIIRNFIGENNIRFDYLTNSAILLFMTCYIFVSIFLSFTENFILSGQHNIIHAIINSIELAKKEWKSVLIILITFTTLPNLLVNILMPSLFVIFIVSLLAHTFYKIGLLILLTKNINLEKKINKIDVFNS